MAPQKLLITHTTYAKLRPAAADELSSAERKVLMEGAEYGVLAYTPAGGKHLRVTLGRELVFTGTGSRNTILVFSEHCQILGREPDNDPHDEPFVPARAAGRSFRLPGYSSIFHMQDPILGATSGGNFTWAEATRNGERMPANKRVVDNIVAIARDMEEVRSRFGHRPVRVTSWYRPPAVNRRVGGARKSRHLSGDAIDFAIHGLSPAEIASDMDRWWGNRGGLAAGRGFVHVDLRGKVSGLRHAPRWSYPGGPRWR